MVACPLPNAPKQTGGVLWPKDCGQHCKGLKPVRRPWGQETRMGGAWPPELEGPRLSLREREVGEGRWHRKSERKSRKRGKKGGEFTAKWEVSLGGRCPPSVAVQGAPAAPWQGIPS